MKLKILSTMMLGCMLCLIALTIESNAQAAIPICHHEGNGSTHLIIVDNNSVADAHIRNHGDWIVTDARPCPTDGDTGGGGDPDPGAVPEPITILLFGTGLAGVGYATRRLRKKGDTENDQQ